MVGGVFETIGGDDSVVIAGVVAGAVRDEQEGERYETSSEAPEEISIGSETTQASAVVAQLSKEGHKHPRIWEVTPTVQVPNACRMQLQSEAGTDI